MFRRICAFVVLAATPLAVIAQHSHPPSDPAASGVPSSLTAEAVQQLIKGEGMGLARPAEVGGYPGPKHVLDLKGELGVSAEQEQKIQGIRQQMLTRAAALGREIVQAELALDGAFKSNRLSEADLTRRVQAIAKMQGELRDVHLQAHLETRPVLTGEQIRKYYELRARKP